MVHSWLVTLTRLIVFLQTVLDSPSIKRIARCDRYTNVKGLCLYFALEKRWLIRSELVNALELLAVKDKSSTSVMMKSDLPADLAKYVNILCKYVVISTQVFLIIRDIYREYMDSSGDQSRILSCCNLLVTLLRGECSLRFDHFGEIRLCSCSPITFQFHFCINNDLNLYCQIGWIPNLCLPYFK